MKKIFQKFWPLFFIFTLWFIFASPYFIKNQVPYPSKFQGNFVPPWSYYEKFWSPIKNNAMPDIIGQIYPWRYFSINVLKTGEIPFWNPYSFAGNPHLANYQSAVFSPLNILFFVPFIRSSVLSFIDAWSIAVLLQPLLAGFFTYFLMREFKVSSFGSAISSISFMFCGFIVVWMAYGTMSLAIAFLPLSILALEKNFKKTNPFWLLVLSLSIPLSFFAGHFQTSLYFLIFTVLFLIFKVAQTKDVKRTFFILLSIILGVIISFVQTIPSIEFYFHSVRSSIFVEKGAGIPFHYFITMFSPDFFGNPVTRNDWFGYYAEWSSFIGIIPLILSFYVLSKKKDLSIFFFIIGILFLFLAAKSPISNIISLLKIPALSTSNPSRIIVLFSFSFAVSAGFGLDNLRDLLLKRQFKKIFLPLGLMGLLYLLVWMLLLLGKTMPIDKTVIAKRNFILPSFLLITSFVAMLFSFINKRLIMLSIFYLLLLVSFDSFRFAQKWMPFDPKSFVFANVPIIEAMKKNIGGGRYFGNLGDQVDSYYGFPSIEGYDPLYINRYGEFIRAASWGEYMQSERSVVKIDRNGKYTERVLDLLGITIIFHPIADTDQGWAYPVWRDKKRYTLMYKDDKFQLFKNNMALPRAKLYYDYDVIKDNRGILKRFYSDDFDFRSRLILEENPNIQKKLNSKGEANILLYSPNKIIIITKTANAAMLFLSDNFYPGWRVAINGKEEKIFRADYSFRAVVVSKGESKVEFSYSPFNF